MTWELKFILKRINVTCKFSTYNSRHIAHPSLNPLTSLENVKRDDFSQQKLRFSWWNNMVLTTSRFLWWVCENSPPLTDMTLTIFFFVIFTIILEEKQCPCYRRNIFREVPLIASKTMSFKFVMAVIRHS